MSPFQEKLEAQYSTVESKNFPLVETKLEANYSTVESKCSLSASENCFSSELKVTSNEQAKLSTLVSRISSFRIIVFYDIC